VFRSSPTRQALRRPAARRLVLDYALPLVRICIFSLLSICLAGCAHKQPAEVAVPPPPPLNSESAASTAPEPNLRNERPSITKDNIDLSQPTLPAGAHPIATEIGIASWYGPPYNHRRGSDGKIYDMHAMTAAHRTLPLGSIVRVTNLRTGHSAVLRITDRGPFIEGRILDLSLAAAKRVDVYLAGTAEVKLEVMETPAPIEIGGRWAVQIGGFPREKAADKLANHLRRRYTTAKVQIFPSPAGDWWVRVRVLDDDRARAQRLATETHSPDGAVFVVRLD
jgi:rare lipoprotein A